MNFVIKETVKERWQVAEVENVERALFLVV
jgi:hypothetical protein